MNSINYISKVEEVKNLIKDVPYFTIGSLSSLGVKDYYLKIIISRLKKSKEIISLKRGLYVSFYYLDKIKKKEKYNDYLEFLSSVLYNPSYLSLEYVLSKNNILSDASFGFSSVSLNKTNNVKNEFGSFYYYNIKKELFTGFNLEKRGDFFVYKATVGKALFDFLYFRKNIINSKDFLKSLRINTDQIKRKDFIELKKYIALDKSKKMNKVFEFLWNIK